MLLYLQMSAAKRIEQEIKEEVDERMAAAAAVPS
jgi:hypothetical protein